MTSANSTRARGVRVQHTDWGIIAQGTREMLVQHEFTQDGLYPGDEGAQGRQRHTDTDPAGREIRIYRKSKYQFAVWRDWSPDERAARELQEEREREIEAAKRQIALWPAAAEDYRKTVRYPLEYATGVLDNVFCSGKMGGYRYDDAAMDRAKFLLDQLRDLFETGTIVMDRTLREEHTPKCIAGTVRAADSAKQDKTFQRFMAGVAK